MSQDQNADRLPGPKEMVRLIGEYVKTHMKASVNAKLSQHDRDQAIANVIGVQGAVLNASAWGYDVRGSGKARYYISLSFKHQIKAKDQESLNVQADGNINIGFYGVSKDKVIARAKQMFPDVAPKGEKPEKDALEVEAQADMIDCGAL